MDSRFRGNDGVGEGRLKRYKFYAKQQIVNALQANIYEACRASISEPYLLFIWNKKRGVKPRVYYNSFNTAFSKLTLE